MKRAFHLLVIAACLLTGACARQVQHDYGQYLIENQDTLRYSRVATSAEYFLTPETDEHLYQLGIPGFIRGKLNMRFGRILDATMLGTEIRSAFGDVERVGSPDEAKGLLITFDLKFFSLVGFKSNRSREEMKIDMIISASNGGQELLSKRYAAVGESQGLYWGPSGPKNKVNKSIKYALDQIMVLFVSDLGKVYKAQQSPPPGRDKVVLGKDGLAQPKTGRPGAS